MSSSASATFNGAAAPRAVVTTRQPPIAPIEAGYTHSVAAIMADEALIRGRRMGFDPARRAIREG